MKIGFSGLGLQSGASRRGVDNYTYQLMRILPQMRAQNEYVYYVWHDCHDFDDLQDAHVEIRRLPFLDRPRQARLATRILAEQVAVPALARAASLDLLHFPDNTIPVLATFLNPVGCPISMTVHDMMIFSHPESMGGFTRAYKSRAAAPSIDKVSAIVCDSFFTRDELVRMFPDAANKSSVIHLAPADHYRPLEPAVAQELLDGSALTLGEYFLYLGPIEFRKNVDGLIKAYARAAALRALPPLVIAGKVALFAESIVDLPAQLGIQDRVHFLGYVSDEMAVALCNGAIAVLYPSWFEGFGLPVLEAMRCGAPVIASNRSSVPEIAGDAAILIDPADSEGLAASLILVAEQPALRAAIAEAGFAWSARFSWERCAQEMIRFWERVAQ